MIIDLNIRHYRHLLMGETDPAGYHLLAEEEVKLTDLLSEESKISSRASHPQKTVKCLIMIKPDKPTSLCSLTEPS